MKKEVKQWFNNSVLIAKNAGESFKAKFEYEIKRRKEALAEFQENPVTITPDLVTGTYRAVGQNPDDVESCYIGNVDFFIENDTWKAKWNIAGFIHSAYGMLITPNILVFNYSYEDADNVTKLGIVSYTFLSNTIVKGSWLEEGFPIKGIEELRKLDANEESKPDSHDANFGFSLN